MGEWHDSVNSSENLNGGKNAASLSSFKGLLSSSGDLLSKAWSRGSLYLQVFCWSRCWLFRSPLKKGVKQKGGNRGRQRKRGEVEEGEQGRESERLCVRGVWRGGGAGY